MPRRCFSPEPKKRRVIKARALEGAVLTDSILPGAPSGDMPAETAPSGVSGRSSRGRGGQSHRRGVASLGLVVWVTLIHVIIFLVAHRSLGDWVVVVAADCRAIRFHYVTVIDDAQNPQFSLAPDFCDFVDVRLFENRRVQNFEVGNPFRRYCIFPSLLSNKTCESLYGLSDIGFSFAVNDDSNYPGMFHYCWRVPGIPYRNRDDRPLSGDKFSDFWIRHAKPRPLLKPHLLDSAFSNLDLPADRIQLASTEYGQANGGSRDRPSKSEIQDDGPVDLRAVAIALAGSTAISTLAIYLLCVGRVRGIPWRRDWRILCACVLFVACVLWAKAALAGFGMEPESAGRNSSYQSEPQYPDQFDATSLVDNSGREIRQSDERIDEQHYGNGGGKTHVSSVPHDLVIAMLLGFFIGFVLALFIVNGAAILMGRSREVFSAARKGGGNDR